MMRIRSIKPEFFTSEQITALSRDARLLFVGLWVFSDDGGRHPSSLVRLKMEVFPGDDIEPMDMARWIGELQTQKLILRYDVRNSESDLEGYWQITGWHHQKIDQPTYRFPDSTGIIPPSPNRRRSFAERSPQESSRDESSGDESNGAERSGAESSGDEKNSSSSSSSSSSWEKARKRAAAVRNILGNAKRWRSTRDMKSLVLHACAIIEAEGMPEAWLDQAVEAVVTAEKVDNPTGFLAKQLTEAARAQAKDFACMRRGLAVPEELLKEETKPAPPVEEILMPTTEERLASARKHSERKRKPKGGE